MTKSKVVSVSVVLVIILALAGVAVAQGIQTLPGSGWWTSVGIQNSGTSMANAVLTAYHVDGGAADTHTSSFTITTGSSVTFIPVSTGAAGTVAVTPPLESGFAGSAVVSSDQPLVAVGQVGNNQQFSNQVGVAGGYASAQYRGSGQGAASISYPTVKNSFASKTTTFYIQAAGSDATVTVTVKTNDGVTHTKSELVSANKTWVVSPSDLVPPVASTSCTTNANTSPCVGSLSAVATGGQVVGAVVEHQAAAAPATLAQSTSLFLPADADTTVYCPTFKNAYGGGAATPRYGCHGSEHFGQCRGYLSDAHLSSRWNEVYCYGECSRWRFLHVQRPNPEHRRIPLGRRRCSDRFGFSRCHVDRSVDCQRQ